MGKRIFSNQIDRPKYFTLRIYKDSSKSSLVIEKIGTKSQAKFSRKLKQIPTQFYGYLKVVYSGGGHNDGFYSSKEELLLAYQAFVEK